MRPRAALAPALLVLVLAGCSLDDDEQRAADNLSSALVTNGSGASERDSSGCVAEAWVGEVGTSALVDERLLTPSLDARRSAVHGLLAGELRVSREVATGLALARLDCADLDAVALDQKKAHPNASAEELDEYADCLKELDRDDWRKSMVAFYTGREARGLDGFRSSLQACNAMLEAADR